MHGHDFNETHLLVAQSLETQADTARTELREATARAAVLQIEAADAHERATAARRRIPELEAKKKAAAASRVRHTRLKLYSEALLNLRHVTTAKLLEDA